MTNEQILTVAAKYETELLSYPAERHAQDSPHLFLPRSRPLALMHARWMCQQIPDQVAAGNTGKAMRWLGFVQGVLWSMGAKSIESMRSDNAGGMGPSAA